MSASHGLSEPTNYRVSRTLVPIGIMGLLLGSYFLGVYAEWIPPIREKDKPDPNLHWVTPVGMFLFFLFGALILFLYSRVSILLSDDGFEYRGIIKTTWTPWADVLRIVWRSGERGMKIYSCRAHFEITIYFAEHQKLCYEIIERIGRANPQAIVEVKFKPARKRLQLDSGTSTLNRH